LLATVDPHRDAGRPSETLRTIGRIRSTFLTKDWLESLTRVGDGWRMKTLITLAVCCGAVASASAQTGSPPPGPSPVPCTSVAERHQFDFWIGEWRVATPDGQPQGKSSVLSIAGGCGLLENWTDLQGRTGKSLNAYNPVTRQWQQYWVGQGGLVTEYRESELDAKSIAFYSRASGFTTRLTFTPLDDTTVRQFSELSTDGEKTWKTQYDYRYHRAR
jgi:hypothetical protein